MTGKGIFRFKKFQIKQYRCAMKIGTDAVLLGGWTPLVNYPNRILDIGAGTGILSLMMAQRSNANDIEAVEVVAEAYEECIDNFENSLWNDRLFCYHADFIDFAEQMSDDDEKYDLIISNPPFFEGNIYRENSPRKQAREQSSLSFYNLLEGVSLLLDREGCFSTIIPYESEDFFCELAEKNQLYPQKITHVRGNAKASIKRSMLLFSHNKSKNISTDELILEKERHQYTDDYKRLVQDFYIFDKHQL